MIEDYCVKNNIINEVEEKLTAEPAEVLKLKLEFEHEELAHKEAQSVREEAQKARNAKKEKARDLRPAELKEAHELCELELKAEQEKALLEAE